MRGPLPYLYLLILCTACHSVLQEANVVAPGHVTDPIFMSENFLCNNEFALLKVPELDLAVYTPANKSFRWELKLNLLRHVKL